MVRENETIDLNELRGFDSVVRHGGITAAAAVLGVSKSTVSIQISRLESRLGTRLLERNSRRVALTREGEEILPRVRSLLAEAGHLLDATSRARTTPRGVVRIAVTPALGSLVLKRLVPALVRQYPDISLVVMPNYGMDDLQDPAFDFAIRIGEVRDESLVAQKIGTFSRILVASPSHPAAHAKAIEDLQHLPLLALSGRSTRVEWHLEKVDDSHSRCELNRDAQIAIMDFEMLLVLARQGNGVAMVPEFMVKSDLAEQQLAHVLPEWRSPPTQVMLVYRVGIARVTRVSAVLDLARIAIISVLGH